VDAPDHWGRTPLMLAAGLGRAAVARSLLAFGADTHPRDRRGRDALFLARAHGHEALARLLESHGARPRLPLPPGAG